MYTIVLVNVKRFRALCGFYAIENKLLLLLNNSARSLVTIAIQHRSVDPSIGGAANQPEDPRNQLEDPRNQT